MENMEEQIQTMADETNKLLKNIGEFTEQYEVISQFIVKLSKVFDM